MKAQASHILDRLRRHASDSPDTLALREVASGEAMTWSDLSVAVDEFAAGLATDLPKDSVVMLRLPNGCDFHVAFLGVLAAGMTAFPVPHELTRAEFDAAAAKSSACAVIDSGLGITPLDHRSAGDGPALLLQSSGTTGLPKVVRRDAAALDAVAANCAEAIRFTARDRVLSCVPLCHSYGLEHGLLAPLFAGATVHLAQGFDLNVVRRELRESAITAFPAVPSIYEMLGNLAGDDDRGGFPKLRVAYSAGAPLPASVFAKVNQTLKIRAAPLYGATEVGSVTFGDSDDPHFDPASVGRPMSNVQVRIDEDHQLHIRAPSMMSGYVGDDDDSPLSSDGFFPTGDLATIDAHSGNLTITGRLKFLIDVGGLKVNPMEVEQAIAEHPAVAACVVVPVRVSETVFRLKAIVTTTSRAAAPTGDELRAFARQRLSGYKVPRVFELRETLPRSATGKILRHLLVETA
jgi:acyl-CoA synthetase (AMP-forming)/AMP-acid ligase II